MSAGGNPGVCVIETMPWLCAPPGEACREPPRALNRLPPEIVQKYFTAISDDRWQLIGELRDSVRFTQVNLVEPAEMRGDVANHALDLAAVVDVELQRLRRTSARHDLLRDGVRATADVVQLARRRSASCPL